MNEPVLAGRLAPSEMWPAGVPQVRTRYVTLPNGLRLRVAESGDAAAPPVLLLHGWGASVYMWRDWMVPLAQAGRRAVAIDLTGHGLSDKPDDESLYRLDALVATVRAFIASELTAPVDVAAQSMAGTIAVELATLPDSPVKRLVLVNPACFGRIRSHRFFRILSPSLVDRFLPRLVKRWLVALAHRLVYGEPSRITSRDEDEYWAPSQFPAYSRAMRRLLHEFRWRRPPADEMAARLAPIARRILVVLGTRDRLVLDAQPYVAAIGACGTSLAVALVEKGGHAVNEERPVEVVAQALRFLD